jgi:four helix bundle protein
MDKNTGFKKLEVWQDAKSIAVELYRITEHLRDFGLRDQMRRAAVSIASNIAEGDERSTDKESVYFFYIAKGSIAELRTQLEIANDVGLLPVSHTENLHNRAESLSHRLGALILHRKQAQ